MRLPQCDDASSITGDGRMIPLIHRVCLFRVFLHSSRRFLSRSCSHSRTSFDIFLPFDSRSQVFSLSFSFLFSLLSDRLSPIVLLLPFPLHPTCPMISRESRLSREILHSSSTTNIRTGIFTYSRRRTAVSLLAFAVDMSDHPKFASKKPQHRRANTVAK